jgi:hypothetical protein
MKPLPERVPSTPRAVAVRHVWPSRPAVLPSMPTKPLPKLLPKPEASVARTLPPAPPAPTPTATAPVRAALTPPKSTPPAPTPSPSPAVVAAPVATVVAEHVVVSEEENVRAALARWRAAYSQLDARAAKHVWPSVDERALERAFQNLKSQEVRFDSCELKMRDESAQAECIGRAIYVPRIGSQTPITAPRAWRFELKRFDQGWAIASARSI